MKKSVYIPDDLWAAVAGTSEDDASASKIVQEALELLRRHREGPLALAPSGIDRLELWATDDLQAQIARLRAEAQEMAALGYRRGVETATQLSWPDLESVSADPSWIYNYIHRRELNLPEVPEPIREGAERLAQEDGVLGTEHEHARFPDDPDVVSYLVIYSEWAKGFARGIVDVRQAVLDQDDDPSDVMQAG